VPLCEQQQQASHIFSVQHQMRIRFLSLFLANVSALQGQGRRSWLHTVTSGGGAAVGVAVLGSPASAACLPGDVSSDCIGVYKQRGTITEKQAAFAEVNFVPPPPEPANYEEAMEQLQQYRTVVATWKEELAKGRKEYVENVGTQLLAVRPRITAIGQRLVRIADPTLSFEDEVEMVRSLTDRDAEPLLPSTFSESAFAQRCRVCGLSSTLRNVLYGMDDVDLELGRLLRSTPERNNVAARSWTMDLITAVAMLKSVEKEYDLLLRYASIMGK